MIVTEPSILDRVKNGPDDSIEVLSGSFEVNGRTVRSARLQLYLEDEDARYGRHVLITSLVRTDGDSVELLYDEGYRGPDALKKAATFLVENLGVSGLLLRSMMALENRQSGP